MNKRHYEHTLPNIRGSLSNTYEEKMSVSRSVRRCPHLSLFVHQYTILQHFKSPLLCNGVTNRKGQAGENGRVCRRAYRYTLTPIRP